MSEARLESMDLESTQTANGRFFINFEDFTAQRLLQESEDFWGNNEDLLQHRAGLISEVALNTIGPDVPPHSNGIKIKRLTFNVGQEQRPTYTWQLAETYEARTYGYPDIKRTIGKITVSPDQISAIEYHMDHAGNLASTTQLAGITLIGKMHDVLRFRSLPETKARVTELRARKNKSMSEVAAYVAHHVTQIAPLSTTMLDFANEADWFSAPHLYDKYTKLKDKANKIGFLALELYDPIQDDVPQLTTLRLKFMHDQISRDART